MRSRECNGVREPFTKTFKRDNASVAPRPEAISLRQRVGIWFEDCSNTHPHSRLRFQFAREFIQ